MQGYVAQALALVTVGNAALGGRDVRRFWPDASVFRFSKICEFLVPVSGDEWRQVAADPLEWFDTLRPSCLGLRLHVAPRPLQAGQSLLNERLSVGFVGGGPRWLIETVGHARSQVWQGFDKLLDRNDPAHKIWANGYLLQGETAPQSLTADPLDLATAELDAVLIDIEQLANELQAGEFGECFANARAALASAGGPPSFYEDIVGYSGMSVEAQRALVAVSSAWVFGGMGSWNDIGAPAELSERYERESEALFRSLQRVIAAIANSTFAV
jgi:hypothetical protein